MTVSIANLRIILIDLGDCDVLSALAAEASKEGYRFVDRLVHEWISGANRFAEPDEKLVGAFQKGRLVAIGGLSRDPYVQESNIGRLRHVYVHPRYRRRGIGRLLVAELLQDLDRTFRKVRLRTDTAVAASFYETYGFCISSEPKATHEWPNAY